MTNDQRRPTHDQRRWTNGELASVNHDSDDRELIEALHDESSLIANIEPSHENLYGDDIVPVDTPFPILNSQFSISDAVLHDISLHIAAGRTLGILGRTGSGKTTLTRLLFRLYDVTDGAIRIGGADIRDLRLDSLRERVGMVTQEVQLFHATVRENLTFFDTSIPDARILAALKDLELMPWYQALPDGLDTVLAAGGGLSAGEAQVLAFTRVFLRDPGLVIMDEASSRLDPATERLVERAVDRLLADRTGIIIAHRLATVMRADDILILENGRIREYGACEALRSDSRSRFAELLRTGMEEVLA
jgi:ABC-type multidrug transport system fused ATPase/permease subunit